MKIKSFLDGKAKSPIPVLCFIHRHCNALTRTPHSSGLARLALEAFCLAIDSTTFCEHAFFLADS
jgi:hypothetical protein